MRRLICSFYANIELCLSVNCRYLEWFDVKRDTGQGDPLSPCLFLKLFQ